MPAENELKYVLDDARGAVESYLSRTVGLADLEQFYIRGTGHAQVFRRQKIKAPGKAKKAAAKKSAAKKFGKHPPTEAAAKPWFGIAFFIPQNGSDQSETVVIETPISEEDHAILSGMKDIKGTCRVRRILAPGARQPQRIFTIKVDPPHKGGWNGNVLEIETSISKRSFDALVSISRSKITKKRATIVEGDLHWDIDFLKDAQGLTYMAMAEVEMPASQTKPAHILPLLAPCVIHEVVKGDKRFNNASLSDPVAVRALVDSHRMPLAA